MLNVVQKYLHARSKSIKVYILLLVISHMVKFYHKNRRIFHRKWRTVIYQKISMFYFFLYQTCTRTCNVACLQQVCSFATFTNYHFKTSLFNVADDVILAELHSYSVEQDQAYKRIGYNLNVMRQSACLVINPITVDGYAALFNCTPVDRASDSMTPT